MWRDRAGAVNDSRMTLSFSTKDHKTGQKAGYFRCDLVCHTPPCTLTPSRERPASAGQRIRRPDVPVQWFGGKATGPGGHNHHADAARTQRAPGTATRRGPDRSKVLDRRRQSGQVTARRVLDLMMCIERGGRGEAATVGGEVDVCAARTPMADRNTWRCLFMFVSSFSFTYCCPVAGDAARRRGRDRAPTRPSCAGGPAAGSGSR